MRSDIDIVSSNLLCLIAENYVADERLFSRRLTSGQSDCAVRRISTEKSVKHYLRNHASATTGICNGLAEIW